MTTTYGIHAASTEYAKQPSRRATDPLSPLIFPTSPTGHAASVKDDFPLASGRFQRFRPLSLPIITAASLLPGFAACDSPPSITGHGIQRIHPKQGSCRSGPESDLQVDGAARWDNCCATLKELLRSAPIGLARRHWRILCCIISGIGPRFHASAINVIRPRFSPWGPG